MTADQYNCRSSDFAGTLRQHMEAWPGFAAGVLLCGPTGRTEYTWAIEIWPRGP